jgi:hypothetical protein
MLWFLSQMRCSSRAELVEAYQSIVTASEYMQNDQPANWDFDSEFFEMLGHVEQVRLEGEIKVYINPPHLARLPTHAEDGQGVIMCGFRSPDMEQLMDQAGFDVQSQPFKTDFLPPRRAFFGQESAIRELGRAIGLKLPFAPEDQNDTAAWQVGHFGRSASDVVDRLNWVNTHLMEPPHDLQFFSPVDHRRTYQRIEGYDFYLSFEARSYGAPTVKLWRNLSESRWESCIVESRWGRYLAMRVDGGQMPELLCYDESARIFAVPKYTPLPWPFGRALSLCSGFVFQPCRVEGDGREYMGFVDVPRAIGQLVSRKIGQSALQESNIELLRKQ